MSETDWRSTVEAAARGDEAARDELVRNYADRVRSRVHAELEQDFRRNHRWILPLFSTRDVVQDVFVAVIRSLSSNAEDLDFPGTSLAQVNVDRLQPTRVDFRQVTELGLTGIGSLTGCLVNEYQLPALAYALAHGAGLGIERDPNEAT